MAYFDKLYIKITRHDIFNVNMNLSETLLKIKILGIRKNTPVIGLKLMAWFDRLYIKINVNYT
jgi:hypothetical protein